MKGKNMSSLVSNGTLAQEAGVYSGATEEEVTEFILSTLREISIMAYSMAVYFRGTRADSKIDRATGRMYSRACRRRLMAQETLYYQHCSKHRCNSRELAAASL